MNCHVKHSVELEKTRGLMRPRVSHALSLGYRWLFGNGLTLRVAAVIR